jgi:deazaflavin-dependent oxidoreductase (nitroreductase family)
MDDAIAAEPFCYLTTTGRVTGNPHRIEIWFAAAPGRETIYLLAGGGARSDWVANLRDDLSCSVDIGDERFAGRARMIEGTDEERPARDLVYEKYHEGDDLDAWREYALPVAIDLTPASRATSA